MSLQEYMNFMMSRETENVQSAAEVEIAFKALSRDGKLYVTKDELYQVSFLFVIVVVKYDICRT